MKISPARTAAFDILFRIETERAYSSVLLPIYEQSLSLADRGLCHELTLGALRHQLLLDRVIDKLASGRKLDIQIRIALRLAIYQLKYLNKIPDYSAINESVNLVQRAKKTSAKGFVNAVLRSYLREPVELAFESDVERISVETSHPRWLIERWINAFGIEKTIEFAQSNNQIPAVAFRIVRRSVEVNEIVSRAKASLYVDGCYLVDRYEPDLLELANKNAIYIQDEASQMIAQAQEIPTGGRFLDVCAAPGGKATLVASGLGMKTGLIVAGDLYGSRVEYLRDNCQRLVGDSINVVQYNAEEGLPFPEKSFDAVLVDAPCSGTGTIRHNPELRYLLAERDLAELPLKQLSILRNASKCVRSGGILVYSTCSVEFEEDENVCAEFRLQVPAFENITPNVSSRFITEKGFARTWPQRDNMDGFFIAAFRRH